MAADESKLQVGLIVATDALGGIAKEGQIPWDCPADLALFKQVTIGGGNNAVVMGRTTWESLPPWARPLGDRLNIVLSRQPGYEAAGAAVASTPLGAVQLAKERGVDELWVIGGKQVYEAFVEMRAVCQMVHTRLTHDYGCDVTFAPPGGGTLTRVTPLPGGDCFCYSWDDRPGL